MPLPQNAPISLLSFQRPGDAVQSKPKHAMLVRLSSEALDALENQNQIHFEFGDKPKIYLGDACYPMFQHPQEADSNRSPHELYLRASSASKKTAPLKLYANVVGKFVVEPGLEKVSDRVRQSTQEVAAQRNTPATKFIETPLDLPPNPKKRKEPPPSVMFRKPIREADKSKPVPAAPAPTPINKAPPPDASTSQASGVPLRKRVVQCLAAGEKSEGEVVRLVGGSSVSAPTRREIQELLDQIAEPTTKGPSSDKSPRVFRLKPQSWKEVRPYEWPMLNEARIVMARAARVAFQSLGIPESDPVWNHVRYRSPGSGMPSTSQHSSSSDPSRSSNSAAFDDASRVKKSDVAPKRGVSSREAKEKSKKPRPDPKAEIMMKDESIKAARSNPPEVHARNEHVRVNSQQERRGESSRMNPPDVRRTEPAVNRRPNDSPRHTDSPPVRRQPVPEPKPMKASGRAEDAYASTSKKPRESDRDPSRSASGARPSSSNPNDEKSLATQRIKKIRRENGGGASDSERERDRVSSNVDRSKMKEKAVKREDSPRNDVRSSATKRKPIERDDDDDFEDKPRASSAQKRRKTESVQLHSSSSSSTRERDRERDREDRDRDREQRMKDGSPLKRSYVEPHPTDRPTPRNVHSVPSSSKHRSSASRQDSPPPAKRSNANSSHANSAVSPAASSQSNNHSSKSRTRRPSPVFTSSDEEDAPSSTRTTTGKTAPAAPGAIAAQPSTSSSHTAREKEPSSRKLPTDHAALRARYNTSYLEYLTSFQRLVMQKGKIDSMLKNNDLASVGSITDSEGDIELMDADELAQLTNSHRKLREELVSIQHAFGRTARNGEPLPAPESLLAV